MSKKQVRAQYTQEFKWEASRALSHGQIVLFQQPIGKPGVAACARCRYIVARLDVGAAWTAHFLQHGLVCFGPHSLKCVM